MHLACKYCAVVYICGGINLAHALLLFYLVYVRKNQLLFQEFFKWFCVCHFIKNSTHKTHKPHNFATCFYENKHKMNLLAEQFIKDKDLRMQRYIGNAW